MEKRKRLFYRRSMNAMSDVADVISGGGGNSETEVARLPTHE